MYKIRMSEAVNERYGICIQADLRITEEPGTVHKRSEWVTVLASDRSKSDNNYSY